MSFSHRDSGLPLPPPPRNTTASLGNNHHHEDPNISSNISDISAINNNNNHNQQSHNNNNISSSSTTSSSGLSLMERNARRASRRNSTTATNNFPPLSQQQQQQRPSHIVDRSPSVRIHPDLIAIRNNNEEEEQQRQQNKNNYEEQEQHRPSDIYSEVSSRLSTVVSSASTHSSYHHKNSNDHAHKQHRRQTQSQMRQDLIDELEKEDNNNQQNFLRVNDTNNSGEEEQQQQQQDQEEQNFTSNPYCEEDLTIKTLAENLHCDGRILETCFSSSSSFHEVSDLAQSLFDALEQDEIATRYAREKQQLNDQTLLDTARTIASLNQTIEKLEDEGRYYQDKYSAKLIEWKKEKEDEQSMAQQYSRQVRDRSREFDKMVSQLNKKEVEFERLMKMNRNPSDGLRRVLGERRTNC